MSDGGSVEVLCVQSISRTRSARLEQVRCARPGTNPHTYRLKYSKLLYLNPDMTKMVLQMLDILIEESGQRNGFGAVEWKCE